MEGYFTLKVKFVLAVLLAALVYVTYLYFFNEQTPDSFQLRENCTADEIVEGTAKTKLFFKNYANEWLERNAIWKEKLRSQPTPWAVATKGAIREKHFFYQEQLMYLNDNILLRECLDPPTQLNAQLLKQHLETTIKGYAYHHYTYPVHIYNGLQDRLSNVLLHECPIHNKTEAEDYIASVARAEGQVKRLIEQLKECAARNVVLPKQLFPELLVAVQSKGSNGTFNGIKNNAIERDFYKKVKQLNLPKEEEKALKATFLKVFNEYWIPAYRRLYDYLLILETEATEAIGVWRFKQGLDFYNYKLQEQTTTNLTIDEVFSLGKDEVKRIHEAIKEQMKQLNYDGNLAAFFNFLRTDQQFYYSNTPKGKAAYLDRVDELIKDFEPVLAQLVSFKPTNQLQVKLKTTHTTTNHSTADAYFIDLSKKEQRSSYQLAALTYANTIPGMHLQIISENSIKSLPQFRQLMFPCSAYQEGWKLYAACLPQEMGYYKDPYAKIGRLVYELWWTCALVVDIGIHCYEWNREEAIEYYQKHTPKGREDCVQMVHQQIVHPAQATAAKLGLITFLELKEKTEEALGEQFELSAFHDVLLKNGAVPLGILQDIVDAYISTIND